MEQARIDREWHLPAVLSGSRRIAGGL